MDEQTLNENQPKVRRAKSGGAEEPQPSRWTQAGRNDQAEQETPENVSEKPSQASEAGEEVSEVSPAIDKDFRQAESVLPWPFQATQNALDEWTHFFGRAVQRITSVKVVGIRV